MRSASSSLRIARARSSTRTPNSVGHRAPPAPHEQLHAELGLELADVLRDVRLHRVEAVGGGGEGAFLGDREQRFELAHVHVRRSLRPNCVRTIRDISDWQIDPIAYNAFDR